MSATEMNSYDNDDLQLAVNEMRSIAVEPVPPHVIQRTLLAMTNDRKRANRESRPVLWTIETFLKRSPQPTGQH